jgi:hypothetical protein
MGQEGKASAERPIVAGHLQNTVGRGKETWEKDHRRFSLFISFTV